MLGQWTAQLAEEPELPPCNVEEQSGAGRGVEAREEEPGEPGWRLAAFLFLIDSMSTEFFDVAHVPVGRRPDEHDLHLGEHLVICDRFDLVFIVTEGGADGAKNTLIVQKMKDHRKASHVAYDLKHENDASFLKKELSAVEAEVKECEDELSRLRQIPEKDQTDPDFMTVVISIQTQETSLEKRTKLVQAIKTRNAAKLQDLYTDRVSFPNPIRSISLSASQVYLAIVFKNDSVKVFRVGDLCGTTSPNCHVSAFALEGGATAYHHFSLRWRKTPMEAYKQMDPEADRLLLLCRDKLLIRKPLDAAPCATLTTSGAGSFPFLAVDWSPDGNRLAISLNAKVIIHDVSSMQDGQIDESRALPVEFLPDCPDLKGKIHHLHWLDRDHIIMGFVPGEEGQEAIEFPDALIGLWKIPADPAASLERLTVFLEEGQDGSDPQKRRLADDRSLYNIHKYLTIYIRKQHIVVLTSNVQTSIICVRFQPGNQEQTVFEPVNGKVSLDDGIYPLACAISLNSEERLRIPSSEKHEIFKNPCSNVFTLTTQGCLKVSAIFDELHNMKFHPVIEDIPPVIQSAMNSEEREEEGEGGEGEEEGAHDSASATSGAERSLSLSREKSKFEALSKRIEASMKALDMKAVTLTTSELEGVRKEQRRLLSELENSQQSKLLLDLAAKAAGPHAGMQGLFDILGCSAAEEAIKFAVLDRDQEVKRSKMQDKMAKIGAQLLSAKLKRRLSKSACKKHVMESLLKAKVATEEVLEKVSTQLSGCPAGPHFRSNRRRGVEWLERAKCARSGPRLHSEIDIDASAETERPSDVQSPQTGPSAVSLPEEDDDSAILLHDVKAAAPQKQLIGAPKSQMPAAAPAAAGKSSVPASTGGAMYPPTSFAAPAAPAAPAAAGKSSFPPTSSAAPPSPFTVGKSTASFTVPISTGGAGAFSMAASSTTASLSGPTKPFAGLERPSLALQEVPSPAFQFQSSPRSLFSPSTTSANSPVANAVPLKNSLLSGGAMSPTTWGAPLSNDVPAFGRTSGLGQSVSGPGVRSSSTLVFPGTSPMSTGYPASQQGQISFSSPSMNPMPGIAGPPISGFLGAAAAKTPEIKFSNFRDPPKE